MADTPKKDCAEALSWLLGTVDNTVILRRTNLGQYRVILDLKYAPLIECRAWTIGEAISEAFQLGYQATAPLPAPPAVSENTHSTSVTGP